jgi:hypothetical protein
MNFNELPEIVQSMYVINFNFLYKLIIIFIFISISFLIIKYWKPKDSKYKMVKAIRTIYYFIAWVVLITIPFHFAYLSPKIALSSIIQPLIFFYTVNFAVLGLVISLNILWYGSAFFTDLITGDNKSNAVKQDMKKYFKGDVKI